MSRILRATATATTAIDSRSCGRPSIRWMKPPPSSPSRLFAGTRTSSKNSSAVSCAFMPILSRLRPRSKPFMPRSTTSRLKPRPPLGLRVGLGDHDHEVAQDAVGDERLGAVEDPVVAVLLGVRLQPLQVRPGAGLRHGDRGDDLAVDEAGQPALLLLVGRQVQQVGRHDVVVEREAHAATADADDLLGDDAVVAEVLDPAAAVLLRDVGAEQALLAGLEPHLAGDDAGLLPLRVVRRDVLVAEGPDAVAEGFVLGFVETSLHGTGC